MNLIAIHSTFYTAAMHPQAIATLLTACSLACGVVAQSETPKVSLAALYQTKPSRANEQSQAYCKRQNANYKPLLEADGSFEGKCVMDDGSSTF